ncbi:MAG: hypothetical protein IPM69_00270 [Ignavibacteria bacterium]|nr:hypothetical protein [Ignavibacteria bacterium]
MWSVILSILLSLGIVPPGATLSDYQTQQVALQNQTSVQNQIVIDQQTEITQGWDEQVINP